MRTIGHGVSFLVLGGMSACSFPTTTELRVRDPGQVSVEVNTPDGHRVILAPGREPEEVTLPRTEPPYLGDVLYEASAIRDTSGAITLRCDACLNVPLQHIVSRDGVATLETPARALPPPISWTNDTLRIPLAYPYYVAGSRSPRGPYTAFRYDLVVPRSSLVDVTRRRPDKHDEGWVYLLAMGIPLTALSVFLYAHMATTTVGSAGWLGEFFGAEFSTLFGLVSDVAGIVELASERGYERRFVP
jgi:hypothetical protein